MKKTPEVIEDDTIEDLIPFVKKMVEKKDQAVQLDLFGGEALLEEDKVKKIIELAEKNLAPEYLNKWVKIKIFTNCILLNEDFLKYTRTKDFVNFNFSLDGGEKSHNATRVYPSGKGSYEDVLNGAALYAKVYERDLRDVFFRYTVSPNNVHYLYDSIIELFNRGVRRITPYLTKEGWDEVSLKVLDQQLESIGDFYIDSIDQNLSIRLFLNPILSISMKNRRKKKTFCGVGISNLCISPKGLIYPCQRFYSNGSHEFIMGDIKNGIDQNNKWSIFFQNVTPEICPKCTNCDTFEDANCEGQCVAAMYEQRGSLTDVLEGTCNAYKITLKHVMKVYDELREHPYYQRSLDHAKRW